MGQYKGFYTYNGEKKPTSFAITKASAEHISGEGEDDSGKYAIALKISKSGWVEGEKNYPKNRIHLVGRAEKDGDEVEKFHGVWEIKDVCSGDFEYQLFK